MVRGCVNKGMDCRGSKWKRVHFILVTWSLGPVLCMASRCLHAAGPGVSISAGRLIQLGVNSAGLEIKQAQ